MGRLAADWHPSTNTVICLAEFVVILTNIRFDFSHFLQIKCAAMSMSPGYACLFVGWVEQPLFLTYYCPALSPLHQRFHWCWFLHLCGTRKFVANFGFKLTLNSHSLLTFLNHSASLSGGKLSIKYYKPKDSHSYSYYTFSHPVSCKDASLSLFYRIYSPDETFF